MPLWVVWLVIGADPGDLRGAAVPRPHLLRPATLGPWPAVLVTALLFGLAHASIYRLLPTFILGVILGVLRWRSGSVLPGIAMHAVNNGLIGTLAQRPAMAAWLGMDAASGALPWTPVVAGTLVMGAALAVLALLTPAADRAAPASHHPVDQLTGPARTPDRA